MNKENKRPGYDKFVKDEFKSKPIIKDADEKEKPVTSSLTKVLKSKESSLKLSKEGKKMFGKALSSIKWIEEDECMDSVQQYVDDFINRSSSEDSESPENMFASEAIGDMGAQEKVYESLGKLVNKYKNKYTLSSIKQWQQEFAKIVVSYRHLIGDPNDDSYGDSIKKPKPMAKIKKTRDDESSEVKRLQQSISNRFTKISKDIKKVKGFENCNSSFNRLGNVQRYFRSMGEMFATYPLTYDQMHYFLGVNWGGPFQNLNDISYFKSANDGISKIYEDKKSAKGEVDGKTPIQVWKKLDSVAQTLDSKWKTIFAKEIKEAPSTEPFFLTGRGLPSEAQQRAEWLRKKKDSTTKSKPKDSTTISKAKKAKKVVVTKTITFY